jgi:hypothetical protein
MFTAVARSIGQAAGTATASASRNDPRAVLPGGGLPRASWFQATVLAGG